MSLNRGPVKTKAIVLKEVQLREADKILVCLSAELGKFSVSARGVKSQKSKNIAACSFLAYSEMIMYSSRDMYSLSQSDVIESFYPIRNDIVRLTYASYFADILLDCVQENDESQNVIRLFLNTLYYLMDNSIDPGYLASLFEFRLLKYIGYTFNANRHCAKCSKEGVTHVSIGKGGFICRECHDTASLKVSEKTMDIIEMILQLPLKKAFELKPDKDDMNEVRKISVKFLTACLDKYYTKLDFLDML